MLDASFNEFIKNSTAKEYALLPADVYQAELKDIECRMSKGYQTEELEPQLNFTFVIIEEGEWYGRRQWMSASVKMVGGAKQSKLYQIMNVLAGRPFTKDECQNVKSFLDNNFLNSFIGQQVRLSVEQKQKLNGEMGNRVGTILPAKESLPAFDESKVKK